MDPPVTITMVHNKPHNRVAWAPHGQEGLCVCPPMIRYHCLTSYIPKTSPELVSNKMDIFPSRSPLPSLSPDDAIIHAAVDLIDSLQNLTPKS